MDNTQTTVVSQPENTEVKAATAVTVTNVSSKDTLNTSDLIKWVKETLIFSTPAILAILVALQGGLDWRLALGAGYSALLAALINLLKKYSSGV